MSTTYAQKQEIAQRVTNNNAANLMDTSLQNVSLQHKADMAMQRMKESGVQAPNMRGIARHAYEHHYTRKEIMEIYKNGRDDARQYVDESGTVFFNIPVKRNGKDEFVGMKANGTVAHAGPFGKKITAQL